MKNIEFSKIVRIIIICLFFISNNVFDFATNIGDKVLESNIDNGFMFMLLIGFSVGGYKLYVEESKQ